MPKKPSQQVAVEPVLELAVSKNDAEEKIQDRINKGKELLTKKINNWENYEAVKKEYYKWSDYNVELLKRLFTNNSLSEEYSSCLGSSYIGFGDEPSLGEEARDLATDINEKIHTLESISERLELIPQVKGITSNPPTATQKIHTNKAFIVHGHDEGAREAVARFLEQLGITPIILHEQASGGRTVIEKLEKNSHVDFAVVLLTPDDVGSVATAKENLNPRARQNVILELGYFVARLGRNRVCALHKGSVELPSDFVGVVYVGMDNAGAWRLLLAKELRESGFAVDLNKAI
ncbi:TIR domain-containing protein [Desulfuromonas acetexigens]|nr:nucleotide-binding protein [Desulfuromonas acetexigens]